MSCVLWLAAMAVAAPIQEMPSWRQVSLRLVDSDGQEEVATVWSFAHSTHAAATKLANALDDATRLVPESKRDEFIAAMILPGWCVSEDEVTASPPRTWVLHLGDQELMDVEIENISAVVAGEAYMFVHCPPLDEKNRTRAWEQVESLLPSLVDQAKQAGIDGVVVDQQADILRRVLVARNEPGRYGAVLRPISDNSMKVLIEQTREGLKNVVSQSSDKHARLLRELWAEAVAGQGLAWRPRQWTPGTDPVFDRIMDRLTKSAKQKAKTSMNRIAEVIARREDPGRTREQRQSDEMLLSSLGLRLEPDHQPVRPAPTPVTYSRPMILTTRPTSRPSSQPASRPGG